MQSYNRLLYWNQITRRIDVFRSDLKVIIVQIWRRNLFLKCSIASLFSFGFWDVLEPDLRALIVV